ncbi:hypothetical protein GCM10011491_41130 [Brucella endophytica]|uniref:Uncharacterized protein n=1 Tax=Brucella endophytica TaxID=1963359 RepID=A0A916SQQ1_9HYPH|nr:hypothetical protein [Brucella endophytica]GGB08911.1 hypothetical protein GCM10011491_41130 [Brucella endophytica]
MPPIPLARTRAGYDVSRKYGVPHAEIATLLNIKEATYLCGLRRLGLDHDPAKSGRLPDMEEILSRVRTELMRLTEGGRVPDKGAVDALVSLAKALKTIIDLERENDTRPAEAAPAAEIRPGELREALALIDRRIDELATLRAAEIIKASPGKV